MEVETLFCPRAALAGSRSTTQSANTAKMVGSPISHNTRNTLTRLWQSFPSFKQNQQRIKIILSNRRFSHQGTVITRARITLEQKLNTDYSVVLKQNTNSTTWKGQNRKWTVHITGSKTMEIRHACTIHTHRQFKVQYSTYAALPPSKISQGESSLCSKTITVRRSTSTSRSPGSRGLRTVRHWSKVIRPSTGGKVNVFNECRGTWWIWNMSLVNSVNMTANTTTPKFHVVRKGTCYSDPGSMQLEL